MKISRSIFSTVSVVSIFSAGPVINLVHAFIPLEPGTRTLIMIVAILLATVTLMIESPRSTHFVFGRESMMLMLFLLMTVFSCFLAQLSGERQGNNDIWRYAVQALVVTISFWGCYAWARARFRTRPIDIGVSIISLICISSVFLEFSGLVSFEAGRNRFFGFMGDGVAWLLSFCTTYLFFRRKYYLFAFCVFALMMTQSRGPFIILLASTLAYLFGTSSSKNKKRYVIGCTVLTIILIIYFVPDFFRDNFGRFYATDVFDNDRSRTTAFSLRIFAANPVFGSGYSSHTYYFKTTVFQHMTAGRQFWATPVSTWAQVLADSGLMGFIPFILFLILVARAAIATIRTRFGGIDHQGLVGLSAWLLTFLFLNHSAAWLLPGSYVSPLVFAASGLVVGARLRSGVGKLHKPLSGKSTAISAHKRAQQKRADLWQREKV